MVDRFRLLKKAFIANKQGLKEVGSKPEAEASKEFSYRSDEARENRIRNMMKKHGISRQLAEKYHEEYVKTGRIDLNRGTSPEEASFFSLQKEKPKTASGGYSRSSFPSLRSSGNVGSSNSSSSSKVPAAIGIYIVLIVISIIGLIIKNFVAYTPAVSLFISIILGLFFFIAIHYTPEAKLKEGMVFITFALDTFTQFMLGLFPESELKKWLITYYVFAWIILAVILFLMGAVDAMGAGERLGKAGWLVLSLILGIALAILFKTVIQSPMNFQDTTHAEYFNLAKAQVVKVAGTLQDTKNFWYDYFGCSAQIFGGSLNYDSCMENKRITRYCTNNFASATERQDCVKQQQELVKQGGKPGVAGSVSDAIKQVTKIEFKEKQLFPRQADDPRTVYPITLKVENPRQQTFMAKLSCEFKSGFDGKNVVPGVVYIVGKQLSEVQIKDKEQEVLVECQPSADLKGKYTLDYTALLSGMQTFSFVKRAFVSKDIDATLRNQVETDNFKTNNDKISRGPAEFALLNFKFGSGDGSQPIVLSGQPIAFSFAVEDVGAGAYKGDIVKINNYNFHGLWERGFNVDQERIGDKECLQGAEISITPAQTKKREPSELKRCFLLLPTDLETLTKDQFKVETFVADLNYDYKITRSIPLEVTPLETSTSSNSMPITAGSNS